jgi:hypothetical protein
MPHLRRGLLLEKSDPDAAEAEIRVGLGIWPDYAYAHWTLADLLAGRGRWTEAADEYRAAVRLRPRRYERVRLLLADALIRSNEPHELSREPASSTERLRHWYSLGVIRLRRGDDAGARTAFTRAASHAQPGAAEADELAAALMQVDTRVRLRNVLRGDLRARDNEDRLELIRHCDLYRWAGGAAKLYEEALAADPNLGPIRGELPCWQAARHAVLAGTGASEDDPPLDDAEKTRLRWRALDWMREEMNARAAQLASGRPEARRRAADFFGRYQNDPNMAGVRDPEAIDALLPDEREAWRAFWREVAQRIAADREEHPSR